MFCSFHLGLRAGKHSYTRGVMPFLWLGAVSEEHLKGSCSKCRSGHTPVQILLMSCLHTCESWSLHWGCPGSPCLCHPGSQANPFFASCLLPVALESGVQQGSWPCLLCPLHIRAGHHPVRVHTPCEAPGQVLVRCRQPDKLERSGHAAAGFRDDET